MSGVARAAGQLLVVGWGAGTTLPPSIAARLRDGRAAGAILFANNMAPDPLETASLCAAIAATAPDDRPALVCVDQEGGRVARVRRPATEWSPMAALGRLPPGEAEIVARRVGAALGRELGALGFSVDFAPVLDVHTNPDNPIIGDRAPATDPARVAALGVALAAGLEQDAGIAACGKHFPGHGDTAQDSHLELPALPHGLDRLRRVELVPFAAAARAGISMIMTAHVLFPALDPALPATLSPRVLSLLRGELGYRGVIVSDDLEMRAVAGRHPIEESVLLGLHAGCDLFLLCHEEALAERAFEALVHAGEKEAPTRARLEESAARVADLKRCFARAHFRPDAALIRAILGSPLHEALAARLREV